MTHSLRADSPRATAMMHNTSGIPSSFRIFSFSFPPYGRCLEDEYKTHPLRADSPRATSSNQLTSGIPSSFRTFSFSFIFPFSFCCHDAASKTQGRAARPHTTTMPFSNCGMPYTILRTLTMLMTKWGKEDEHLFTAGAMLEHRCHKMPSESPNNLKWRPVTIYTQIMMPHSFKGINEEGDNSTSSGAGAKGWYPEHPLDDPFFSLYKLLIIFNWSPGPVATLLNVTMMGPHHEWQMPETLQPQSERHITLPNYSVISWEDQDFFSSLCINLQKLCRALRTQWVLSLLFVLCCCYKHNIVKRLTQHKLQKINAALTATRMHKLNLLSFTFFFALCCICFRFIPVLAIFPKNKFSSHKELNHTQALATLPIFANLAHSCLVMFLMLELTLITLPTLMHTLSFLLNPHWLGKVRPLFPNVPWTVNGPNLFFPDLIRNLANLPEV